VTINDTVYEVHGLALDKNGLEFSFEGHPVLVLAKSIQDVTGRSEFGYVLILYPTQAEYESQVLFHGVPSEVRRVSETNVYELGYACSLKAPDELWQILLCKADRAQRAHGPN